MVICEPIHLSIGEEVYMLIPINEENFWDLDLSNERDVFVS